MLLVVQCLLVCVFVGVRVFSWVFVFSPCIVLQFYVFYFGNHLAEEERLGAD